MGKCKFIAVPLLCLYLRMQVERDLVNVLAVALDIVSNDDGLAFHVERIRSGVGDAQQRVAVVAASYNDFSGFFSKKGQVRLVVVDPKAGSALDAWSFSSTLMVLCARVPLK